MHSSPSSATARGTPSRRGRSAAASPAPSAPDSSTRGEGKFFSSLDIPVEGAIPLGPDGAPVRPTNDTEEPKRAARKSKTDALAALSSRGDLDTLSTKYLDGASIQVNPSLDLTTVKTSGARQPLSNTPLRPMGIQNCPEYYPTIDEFKDPMGYIKAISDEAQNYGICKIVPPEGWEMPFVTDTETFRFKTRLQRLNSIEASSRAKLNFLEQLYRYHKQQGNPRVAVPTINHKPLDLWLLRKEVKRLGGYDEVTKQKKWPDMGRLLGYGGIPGLSTQIKNSYTRVILPYEHFCERVRNSPTLSPLLARDDESKAQINSHAPPKPSKLSTSLTKGSTPEPTSPTPAQALSPLSDVSEDMEKDVSTPNGRPKRNIPQPATSATPVAQASLLPGSKAAREQTCEVCHKKNRGEEMLLCDGCDCGFHMFCLDPPLSVIPREQWFCYTCLAGTGGDYGFDEGEEHSLSSFQARDKEFRRFWFERHPPAGREEEVPKEMQSKVGDVVISEYDLEEEFWRLVETQQETVEVEYGADVHSTTHGSAMPTMETHPLDQYARDPWNLNNIAIVPDSLLRFIKSDISGMTVPWTYVGMTFSTFCWHNEDHYTHSINFMHWGETKTWYGIPGEDAEKFEAAIRYEAPDLFEAQPDLLFQLVTLMNPKRVSEAGVRVYACNQRAGEFVVTFPKAYHAGFNHGMNFNEAVNFALPEWLGLGLDCVKRYREHRKLPVFSHDELLITITQQSFSVKTSVWLSDSLQEMVNREMEDRGAARSLKMKELLVPEDRPEDQYQCTVCKAFCYLSQVTCACTTKVVCVEHANLLCEKSHDHLVLRLRFSDADLLDIQRKVHEKASSPLQWKTKFEKLLIESARPSLRSLRAILAEGDRLGVQYSDLSSLRKCVTKANEWVDTANNLFLVRKSKNRARKSARGKSSMEIDELEPVQRGLDELYLLLENVETLGFDSPEIAGLRSLGAQAEDAKAKTAKLLGVPVEEQDDAYLQECKMVLLNSESINVHLEEVQQLVGIVDRDKLLKELEKLQAGGHSTLEDVKAYLSRAKTCGLADSHPQMQVLQARLQEGYEWEQEAHRLLQKPIKTIEEMQAFLDKESTVPVDPDLLDSIATTHAKAMDFDRQADAWLSCNPGAPRPRVSEVMRLCQRAEKEFDLKSIREIKRTADIAIEMEGRCELVLKNSLEQNDSTDFFTMFDEWRTYGINHLRMFQLPGFTKFEQQLDAHDAWLKELPWWCPEHCVPHSEVILQEVIAMTNPDDDGPPSDDASTCICQKPVRGPENPNDPPSDAVQCDHCFARFHGACARKGGSCPFCDHHHWNGSIRKTRNWHSFYFPAILMKAPDLSKNYSRAWKDLQVIIHRLDRLCNVIGTFLMFASQPVNQKQELIPQTRHFMRKLYKLEFAVSPSPDISFGLDLSGLHRVLAHMPHAPSTTHQRPRRRYCHFIFGQDVDSDWADGTRCICRGRTSYLLAYSTVKCCQCRRVYHSGCVFYNQDPSSFECPLCCLRKGKTYNYCDVRVKPNMTSEDARNPDKFVDTKTMTITGSDRLIFSMMPDPTRPTIFVELVKFKISDTDPSAIDLTGSHGHTNGSSYVGAPPPPPWSNGGSNGTSSASSASAPPRPAPPISAASSGRLEARNPYPAAYQPPPPRSQAVEYQHYDPRNPTKKRKVDDLQKFGGDVALFGAHGDHAGNRRWTERSKAAHAPSHHSPIAASPSSAAPSRHYSAEGSRAGDPVAGPSRSASMTDNGYRGTKRKAEDDDEIVYTGHRVAGDRRMSVSMSASPTTPRAEKPGLSPSLAMLMSPSQTSPPPRTSPVVQKPPSQIPPPRLPPINTNGSASDGPSLPPIKDVVRNGLP